MDTTQEILRVSNFSVTYRQAEGIPLEAVKDVSFDLRRGEVLGIIGESGAGKSTVGWGILGMIEPPHECKGEIVVNRNGKNVLAMEQRELNEYRWSEVAMIFQSAMNSLDPVITVGKNFAQVLLDKGVVRTKVEAKARIAELFQTVGLGEGVPDMYPFELSGGMKQRASIAMALGTGPSVLIADEPTTALDTVTQFSVLSLLLELKKEGKIGGMLLISHDLSVQAYMADRAIVMLRGRMLENGSKQEIFGDPKHPYTQFLMSSLKLEGTGLKKGLSTSGIKAPPGVGCPFANLCPFVMEKCTEKFPEMTRLSDTRSVACYLYGG